MNWFVWVLLGTLSLRLPLSRQLEVLKHAVTIQVLHWVCTDCEMVKVKQEQLHELNMHRETWCCVEADSRIWDRPERKHFAYHLRNICDFSAMQAGKPEDRSSWMKSQTSYREKRHFDESCKRKRLILTWCLNSQLKHVNTIV